MSNGRQARADIGRTANSLGSIQRTASRATKVIAGVFAIRSLARAAAAVGRVGASYVDSLNKIQALTGATDRQMSRVAEGLEGQADAFARFGQTTGDAAKGMVELTKSGLSARNALAAVRGTMTLAKAGELEVADASELVANTLNTFNLRASKAADIANSLANAANISSANVSDVAESFKYVAPLAAKANVSVDQTNALLAELANSGIKASQAGTSLRKFLLSLQAPTGAAKDAIQGLGVSVYDAEGNMRPISSLIEQLNSGLSKLTSKGQNKALRDIFGLTGITGAQVVLEGGLDGLREYTKGVKRAGAATKLAESASKGLAGTLGSMKARATSTAQELYRKFSPALDDRLQALSSSLSDNRDKMVAAGQAAADKLLPAIKSLADLAKDAGEAFADTAIPLAKKLLPAIGDLLDLVTKAADAAGDLPGPVKEIGVQAGIAALLLPRLTASVTSVTSSVALNIARLQQWRAEMSYTATRTQQVSAMMSRLGGAARTAAGIGGMVALTQSTQQANEGLRALESVAGGALLGFSVGGPVGAVVGGLAGAITAVATASDGAADSMLVAKPKVEGFADSLSKVSGAATRAAQDVARLSLQQNGAFEAGRRLGIASRDLVQASLGQEDAMRRVGRAVDATERAQNRYFNKTGIYAPQITNDLITLKNTLGATSEQFQKDRAEARQAALANGEFSRSLKGIDKATRRKITTRIDMRGWPEGERQIARVIRGLVNVGNKKQIRTVLKTLGANESVKDVQRVLRELRRADRTRSEPEVRIDSKAARANLTDWQRSLVSALASGKRTAVKGGHSVREGLEDGPGKARSNLGPFVDSIRTELGPAKTAASSGGEQVGANLKAGVMAGFSGTLTALSAAAANAVRAAVAAARAAGKIHSPSRETRDKVGKPLGDGITVGFIESVRKGSAGITKVLDGLIKRIEKKYDGKKQAARRKSLLKSLRDERAALIANGRQQDRNNKALEKAVGQYKALRTRANEFAKSIKTGFQTFGSIVGLGTTGGGTAVTLPAILSQLTARASVADQFSDVIDSLRKKLNKTSLRQLLEQAASGDIEGALATASAIAAGGQGAIAQINQLTAQINEAGKKLGEKMRRQFFGHGLDVAEGVVKGLKRRERQLDRIADRLAQEFIRKAGLPQPSGAGGGSHDKTVVISGSRTPALDAYMSTRTVTAPPTTVSVRLSAEQVSQLERGREIQADLDVYLGAGGRAKVKKR